MEMNLNTLPRTATAAPADSDTGAGPADPDADTSGPGIDADFEAARLDGLGDDAPASSDDPDAPTLAEVAAAPADPDAGAPPAHDPDADAPEPGIDADFEAALLDGLGDDPAASSDDPDALALTGPAVADAPAPGIDADFEAAGLDGLGDDPPASSDDPAAPALAEAALEPAGPAVGAPPAEDPHADAPRPGIDADFEAALLDGLGDDPAASSDDPTAPALADAAPAPADPDAGGVPAQEDTAGAPGPGIDADFEAALLDGLGDDPPASSDDPTDPALAEAAPAPAADPDAGAVPAQDADADAPGPGIDAGFEAALLDGLGDDPPASSDDPALAEVALATTDPAPGAVPAQDADADAPGPGIDAGFEAALLGGLGARMPDRPAAALAFAADPATEEALRGGLLHYQGASSDCEDPQVWPGGVRTAVAALAEGHSTPLIIVDIDGIPYPAGAIHELAEVCEIGTVVIAVGSEDTARINREIMLAGVSDYLVKPITAAAVREAVARAATSERDSPARGRVAGFAGTGGSGTTTLVTLTALHAAEQGRYVSLLDLNRTVPAITLLLDIEPAPGLDQLFDAAGRTPSDPQMLDGVRAERSDRISVYAYRVGAAPPPPPPPPAAVDWLLGQLKRRSQLVLVDGLEGPETRLAPLAEVDTRILVVEPTVGGAIRAARLFDLLGGGVPALLVENHTRAFRRGAAERLLRGAGVGTPPDVVVPFEPSLPGITDRGWPQGRLPRRLRAPVASLADRILAPAEAAELSWRP